MQRCGEQVYYVMSYLLHANFNIMSTGSSSRACTRKLLKNIPLLLSLDFYDPKPLSNWHALCQWAIIIGHHISSGTCLYLWWLTCTVLVERLTSPTPMQVAFSTRRPFHGKDALCGDSGIDIMMVKATDGAMETGIEDGLMKEAFLLRLSSQIGFQNLWSGWESILVAFEDSFLILFASRCLHSHW